MTDVRVPQPLAQAIYDYLVQQPMREVEQLVTSLRAVQPIPEDTPNGAASPSDQLVEA